MQDVLKNLRTQFYAPVPIEIKRGEVDAAIKAFMSFLTLDDEVKKQIDFSIAPEHRRGDVGYKFRRAEDHIYDDNKEFFHYHPAINEEYTELIQQNPLLEEFLNHAKPLWNKVYACIENVFSQLEEEFPNIKSRILEADRPHVVLRFLKYHFDTAGKYLAKPHYDAGAFTLAIAESSPGLRIGSGPEDLQLVEHKEGQALFMISSNYEKLTSKTELKASWHDVIQVDKSQIGKPSTRWALVTFIDAKGVEALPRTQTHKWFNAV